jgi:protein disulfide-isomerase A1
LTAFCADIEKDEGVLVLTEENFNDAIAQNSKLLVEFYAPWCGHCKKLAPEYAAAAQVLAAQNPPIYIGKVDATIHSGLGSKYAVQGYPTLKWFVNGEPQEYQGGRTKDEIVNWINKKSGPPSKSVDASELDTAIETNKITVVYFGAEGEQFTAFEKAASTDDKRSYIHTSSADAASKHGVTGPKVVLFRKFDEPKVEFSGAWESAAIAAFVEENSVPTLVHFSDDFIEPIFQKQKPAIFLFRGEDSAKDLDESFGKAATANKGRIIFSVSGVTNGIQQRLAEFVGVTDKDLPRIVLIEFGAAGVDKFVFSGDAGSFTVEQITSFVDDWKNKKLTKFLKSEDIPATNDEPVKIIVGKNFNQIVRDSEDDVLLEFYAPWCGHCKSLAPKYDELATELKDVKGLVIAKCDSTQNEIEGVSVTGFPTIKFFPKGSKRAPIDYDGEREVEGFKTWLKAQSAAYKSFLEKKDDL